MIGLYAVTLPYCYYTAGEPRKAAMIHAQQLADEKWASESEEVATDETREEVANETSKLEVSGGELCSVMFYIIY
jgi:hypothetical protein